MDLQALGLIEPTTIHVTSAGSVSPGVSKKKKTVTLTFKMKSHCIFKAHVISKNYA